MLIKRLLLLICFTILCLNLSSCSVNKEKNPEEVVKAEKLLSDNTPYKDLILDEVKKGYITAIDIEIYLFMQERFEYYEKLDGKYIISKHDPLVTQETEKHFNLSKEEVDNKHYKVGSIMVGIKPKEETKLDIESIPVNITIDKVEVSPNKELTVYATNSTEYDGALPNINMSFDLYHNDEKIGFQIVWAKDFNKGSSIFKSLPISDTFDSVGCTAYINVNNMKSKNMKSTIQDSNDKGETVIPVYIMPKTKVK